MRGPERNHEVKHRLVGAIRTREERLEAIAYPNGVLSFVHDVCAKDDVERG